MITNVPTSKVKRFFDYFNNVDPNTNCTIEYEQDHKLAFLDLLVMRTQDGKLITKVYRKQPTPINI